MSLFPRLRLALLALLAVAVASGTFIARADAAMGLGGHAQYDRPHYDQAQPPLDESVVPDHDPLSFDDDPTETGRPSFACAPNRTDTRRRAMIGHDWRGGFRHFVIPFETGPPAA